MQILSKKVVVGGNGTEGLQSPFRNWAKGLRESAHSIEEIHEPSQLRPLEAGQILILFVMLNQAMEVTREIKRRSI